jgi:predicted nucleotidyltransferase
VAEGILRQGTVVVWFRGSRGDVGGSDIDILVDFSAPVTLFEFARLRRHLQSLLGRPVDLVTRDALKPQLRERVLRGLKSLGHEIGRNTIKAILKDHGIAPAPERGTHTPWKTFLAAHWDGLAAADSFTVEVLTFGGLVRYVVFFVMKLKTRAAEIAGITSQPDEVWKTQLARNLTDASTAFSASFSTSFWIGIRSTPPPSGASCETVA